MKTLALYLITIIFAVPVFAQQSAKADDALLLDYYQNQRFADAADYLKKTYPEPVNDVKILSGLAYASQMAGRLPEAQDYYERIYVTDTTNTAVMFSLGGINIRRGDNVKALGYYKRILQKDSTNFSVYKQMATLAQNTGNFTDATKYLQKANTINPLEPDVAYDLTVFYINMKLYDKADTVVTIALKADSANMLLLSGKAQADFQLKKYPETIQVCTKLQQAGDQTSPVIKMLAISYYSLKNYTGCINAFKHMEETGTANETSYYYTAMSYKALKKQSIAVIYFDKAIKEAISGNVNSYYGEMADSYDQIHQAKKAAVAYQKSLLYGVLPLTYYALASLYDTELKNKALAKHYYKKYLSSKPEEAGQTSYIAYVKSRLKKLKD
jgi:tetratricopeptide (TPR) repeat protein